VSRLDLPKIAGSGAVGAGVANGVGGGVGGQSRTTGTLSYGVTVEEILRVSSFAGARVLAGEDGLGRLVQRLNIMEVPDVLAWVKPHELLLTTGYPLRNTPEALRHFVGDLDERGLAALAIKLGRYLDTVPDEMLEEADRLGFPVIELPGEAAFDDILNQVLTDILNRQAAVLAESEAVHRVLVQIVLDGGGLEELTTELAGILDAAVFATDADGNVLARAGSAPLLADGAAGCLGADGRLSLDVHESPSSRGPLDGGRRAVVRVMAGGADFGRIVAYADPGRLDERDVHTLERAATVSALVITKQQAVAAVESKYRGDFLRDALSGRAGTEEQIVDHARSLGWALDRPMAVVVAEFDDENVGPAQSEQRGAQDRFTAAWTSEVRRLDRNAAVAGFAHEVVVVIGVPGDGDVVPVVRQLIAAVTEDRWLPSTFSTGVSRAASSPVLLGEAYEQARRALRVGRRMQGPGAVADFDSLGVHRLLSLVADPDELQAFVSETLGSLADATPAAADLRATLDVLLETNLNVAETARRLHFHYNSLRYRMAKLERILGPFTEDAHLRLSLTLALRVLEMRGI
jgi:PucR family transcriptional regulator, purine catabolism regulatory protein